MSGAVAEAGLWLWLFHRENSLHVWIIPLPFLLNRGCRLQTSSRCRCVAKDLPHTTTATLRLCVRGELQDHCDSTQWTEPRQLLLSRLLYLVFGGKLLSSVLLALLKDLGFSEAEGLSCNPIRACQVIPLCSYQHFPATASQPALATTGKCRCLHCRH